MSVLTFDRTALEALSDDDLALVRREIESIQLARAIVRAGVRADEIRREVAK